MFSEIYTPAEDSFLLSTCLKKYLSSKNKNLKILDMGSGSGIQAQTCRKSGFSNILCADINKYTVKKLKKQNFKAVHSNLFSNIKQKFDLIIFNPPYLPEHRYDKKPDTTAGKKGNEIIINFLKQAANHLNSNATILLLFSSASQPNLIKQKAKELNYSCELIKKKNLFFEKLFVYKTKKKKKKLKGTMLLLLVAVLHLPF